MQKFSSRPSGSHCLASSFGISDRASGSDPIAPAASSMISIPAPSAGLRASQLCATGASQCGSVPEHREWLLLSSAAGADWDAHLLSYAALAPSVCCWLMPPPPAGPRPAPAIRASDAALSRRQQPCCAVPYAHGSADASVTAGGGRRRVHGCNLAAALQEQRGAETISQGWRHLQHHPWRPRRAARVVRNTAVSRLMTVDMLRSWRSVCGVMCCMQYLCISIATLSLQLRRQVRRRATYVRSRPSCFVVPSL